MIILSLGAGVQSTALALMAAHGEIGPMPDCAIFADTQAEPASVYEHLRWLMSPNVLPFPVRVVTRGNLAADSLTIRTSKKSGRRYQKHLVPLYTKADDGSEGMLPRRCTQDYKVNEIIRKIKKLNGGKKQCVEQWIGISTDEAHRMKPAPVEWITNRWPLIERRMNRNDCLLWMQRRGYPRPPKSACVFCPYHNDREWRRLKKEEPEAFASAIAFERSLQGANEQDAVMRGMPYLHRSMTPLDEVDFSPDDRQLDMFANECEGMCGV